MKNWDMEIPILIVENFQNFSTALEFWNISDSDNSQNFPLISRWFSVDVPIDMKPKKYFLLNTIHV